MNPSQHYIGLTKKQVEQSRAKHGSNLLTPKKKKSALLLFLQKFTAPLIIILLVAGTLSLGISYLEYTASNGDMSSFFEPVGIFVAIFLATGLSFYFEHKAESEFELLSQVNDDTPVRVVRDGNTTEVPRRDIVVGDLVLLSPGDEVPADGRLLQANGLSVDESTLTGELLCRKTTIAADFDPEATFPSNHCLRGTKVMEGTGLLQVFAVGDNSEGGKVLQAASIDSGAETPLSRQLSGLSKVITKVSYILALTLVVGRIAMYFAGGGSTDWIAFTEHVLQSVMLAVTLVVVAVPEGLPMAVTLSLAYSMQRMLHTACLPRKMHACETMGATTVVLTDKTGTLTQNQMNVVEAVFPSLETDFPFVTEAIAANTTAALDRSSAEHPAPVGNPTEGALLLWLQSKGVDYLSVRESIPAEASQPFSSEKEYMATVCRSLIRKETTILHVKGAPEIILAACTALPEGFTRDSLKQQLLVFQSKGFRTLALAYKEISDGEASVAIDDISGLTLLGVFAIADPVREDVPDAIRTCLDAGIEVKIVTGDTPATAREIAIQTGLWRENDTIERNTLTGAAMAELSDEELSARLPELRIVARARPMDKRRLVELLQAQNQVVAVTGDGTNDAPALKAAQVGLSMGSGTSVAKEASDITILDDSFASIARAVLWGRSLYQNIQRFILFQTTVNVCACLIVLIGAFFGTESPLTVTQMLWVNLIMDTFAAIALASLPPTPSVMKDKPRSPSASILSKPITRNILSVGVLFTALLMGMLFLFRYCNYDALSARLGQWGITFPLSDPTLWEHTVVFTVFVFLQFWNMFNARAFHTRGSALALRGCKGFLLIAALILAGQWIITRFGGEMFTVTPLSWQEFALLLIATSPVLWIGELCRLVAAIVGFFKK